MPSRDGLGFKPMAMGLFLKTGALSNLLSSKALHVRMPLKQVQMGLDSSRVIATDSRQPSQV